MKVDVYWIDAGRGTRLAVMPRPRAGDWLEDELLAWVRLFREAARGPG